MMQEEKHLLCLRRRREVSMPQAAMPCASKEYLGEKTEPVRFNAASGNAMMQVNDVERALGKVRFQCRKRQCHDARMVRITHGLPI